MYPCIEEGLIMPVKIVNYTALGEKIRHKRLSSKLSQSEVAEHVGLSDSFYGHIERGSRKPSIESIVAIADYLDISLDFLFFESKPTRTDNERLQSELDNIFRDKTPSQRNYLLNILNALSDSIEKLHP
jgi:transcriptional regulator with XRE-family HTH domain